jgi:hypothetical protein
VTGEAHIGVLEVLPFIPLRRQPGASGVGEDRIEQHQALDEPAERRRLAVPIVRFPDRLIEGLVLDVIEPSAMEGAERDGGGVAAAEELLQEIMCLLPVRDAGELPVLPLQEDAAMEEHVQEEARLPLREAKVSDGVDARLVRTVSEDVPAPLRHRRPRA